MTGIFIPWVALMYFNSVYIQSSINAFISPWCLNSLILIPKWITVSFPCVQTDVQHIDNYTEKQKKGNLFRLPSWRWSPYTLKSLIQFQIHQSVLLESCAEWGSASLWPCFMLIFDNGSCASTRVMFWCLFSSIHHVFIKSRIII